MAGWNYKNPLWTITKTGRNEQGQTYTKHVIEGTGPYKLKMKSDNNLVLYDRDNEARWTSGGGRGPTQSGDTVTMAKMQDDGNLAVYNGNGNAVWATGQFGGCNICYESAKARNEIP